MYEKAADMVISKFAIENANLKMQIAMMQLEIEELKKEQAEGK